MRNARSSARWEFTMRSRSPTSPPSGLPSEVLSALDDNRRPLLPDSDAADGECKPLPERENAPLMFMGVLPTVEIRLGGPVAAGVCIACLPALQVMYQF